MKRSGEISNNKLMDYIKVYGLQKDEVIGLVKEWVKLYPHSFNPEVNFWFYQLADNQVIIGLHDDLSTLAVSLLVIYLTSALKETQDAEPVVEMLLTIGAGDGRVIYATPQIGWVVMSYIDRMDGASIYRWAEQSEAAE